jgi:hypothetical protein
MSNTFTPITPFPTGTAASPAVAGIVATMSSGGVSPPTPLPEGGFSMSPVAPLPVTGTGQASTAI